MAGEQRLGPTAENKACWLLSADEISRTFRTDLKRGLSSVDAQLKLKTIGPNQLPEAKRTTPLQIFLNQFTSLIVWVLIGAALIAGLLGEWLDTIAILIIIVLNAILGFIQEFRAEKSLAALKELSTPTSRVIRDGKLKSIPSPELVPGDLVLLEAGDRIPGDGRIVRSVQLRCQEAALTGESMPVDKSIDPIKQKEVGIGDRFNMAFMGTVVVNGKGEMIVTDTALKTELGKIALLLKEGKEEKTPLQNKLNQLGKRLVLLFLGVVIIVYALGVMRGIELMEMLLMALSLAVAAIPEGLPAVVTVTLAIGVQKMAKRHALIRKLPSVETLGCATVICSDKTGTLTQNEMTVRSVWVNEDFIEVTGVGYAPHGEFRKGNQSVQAKALPELDLALRIALLCNGAELRESQGRWEMIGDPTEGALLTLSGKGGYQKDILEVENPLIEEIPFNSDRKRMSMLRKTNQGTMLFVKGAPDVILSCSSNVLFEGKTMSLTNAHQNRIQEANHFLASNAYRVLAVAYRPIQENSKVNESMEKDLTFVGLIAMMDPPRPEAKQAIKTCAEAGIRPVMITGDHKETAIAVSKELGLIESKSKALNGLELNQLSEQELEKQVEDISVYARVSAEHKLKIVDAWQKRGAIVAMTGDGVNDAPAIKEADIGVAMGITGTDVTKEASDMVITDDNFASIVNAVEEGRGIYDNIVKFIKFLLSYNVAEIIVILTIILIGLKDAAGNVFIPLTAVQILWMNLITDGLPALALGVDPLAPHAMKRAPRKTSEAIFNRGFLLHLGFISGTVALASLTACFVGLRESPEIARTMTLTTLVMLELMGAQMVRSVYDLSFFSNRWLLTALIFSWLLQLMIIYAPNLQPIFDCVPLGWSHWQVILGIGVTVWGLSWFVNKVFKRYFIECS